MGDITDLQEAKQYQKTAGHASVVVSNVLSYLEGEELKQQCKPGREIIMISNGRVRFFFCFGNPVYTAPFFNINSFYRTEALATLQFLVV